MLKHRFEKLRAQHEAEAAGTARKALADPRAYDLNALNEPQRKALIRFREAWQEELKACVFLDPACAGIKRSLTCLPTSYPSSLVPSK